MSQYEERDPEKLDEAGGFYTLHVRAMTAEQLRSKTAIAAELGYRDMRIAHLQAQLQELNDRLEAVDGQAYYAAREIAKSYGTGYMAVYGDGSIAALDPVKITLTINE